MAKSKALICPYCGETQPNGDRCRVCGGLFEPLSRQATHNEMGPWFIRNPDRPFQPGCSYETLIKLIERGIVTKLTVLRGPTTKQFWTIARRVPGVAHLLGYCHNCDTDVDREDHGCYSCGVPFGAYLDRNYLGLPEIRPLPWEAPTDELAPTPLPPSSRMSSFHRAAEPVGISSFASDSELLATGDAAGVGAVHGGETAVVPQALPQSMAAVQTFEPHVGGASPAPSTVAQTIAALNAASEARKQLDQQKQTIRWLIFGLVGVAVAATIAIAVFMQSRNATPVEVPEVAPVVQPDDTLVPPTDSANDFDVNAALDRVAELDAIFADVERSLEDRIDAGEEALATLKNIRAKASMGQKPADLAQRIAELEKVLDDLRLNAYFP